MLERGFYDRVIVDYFFDLKVQSDFVDYLFRETQGLVPVSLNHKENMTVAGICLITKV